MKLRPIKWGLIFSLILILSILVISLIAVYDAFLDEQSRLDAYGYTWLAFAVFNFSLWIFRKDLVSLSFLLINLIMAVSYLSDYKGVFISAPLILLFSGYLYVIYINHKFSSHYRRLLELAARPVNSVNDGFTPRPFPAGNLPLNKEKLFDFTNFLKKNYIAFPYIDEDGVVLAIKDHRRFWFGRPSERRDSYISINYNGQIAVNIAKKDYQKYKEEYSFDELCQSLANLFKRFYEYYRSGNESRILIELNEEN
ncbi:hypothetical protein GF337_00460 [candidate division KSB1 bacterium]|nr:hypothetical protein [candidate division KSB1 bacterium]